MGTIHRNSIIYSLIHSILLLLFLLLASTTLATAQKVANYAYGEPGSQAYESLSFWTDGTKRTDVIYAYGSDRKEVKLRYGGKQGTGFKLLFPNQHVLVVVPKGDRLQVSDPRRPSAKSFSWQYEGPVDGAGTFCRPCAQSEGEAIQLVRTYFVNR
jgi:hypothetical protein